MHDMRYAIRTLARRPGFMTVVVLTLGLGIGLSTAMFSFADAILFKPLADLPDADRLIVIGEGRSVSSQAPSGTPPSGTPPSTSGGPFSTSTSPPIFFAWRDQQRMLSQVAAVGIYPTEVVYAGRDRAELVQGRRASSGFFETIGVPLLFGRGSDPADDRAGGERTVVLTHRYWQTHFGANPAVLGTAMRLNGDPHTIVGVLPPHAFFERQATEVWLPLALKPDEIHLNNYMLQVHARLKPGVTIAQAEADLNRVEDSLKREGRTASADAIVQARPYRDSIVGRDMRQTVLLLMGAVGFILLITCTNVANLMLAHYARSGKDVAIRLALGAGRARLVRQFIAESFILCTLGGVVGLGAAFWLVHGLVAAMPATTLPPEAGVAIDLRVLLFAAIVSIATGLLFGLLPVWQSSRADLTMAGLRTRSGGSGGASDAAGRLARHALLVAEIALTVMLVIGSTLLFRSLVALLHIDPGFRAANTIAIMVKPDPQRFTSRAHVLAYQDAMLDRLRPLPGVTHVAMSTLLPLTGRNSSTRIGRPDIAGSRAGAGLRYVSPDYFATMGIALVRGRLLSERDTAGAPNAIVINETLAKTFWPNQDPIGRPFAFHDRTATVVGVIADVKHQRLTGNAINEFYIPFAQASDKAAFGQLAFSMRATDDAAARRALMSAVRDIATAVDRDVPVASIKSMDDYVADGIAQPRFLSSLFGLFGGLSLALAAVGLYGVLSYVVGERTHEFGIRLALGAQRRDVFHLVMTQGLIITAIGLAIGAAGGYALTRLLATTLFGVTARDPLTYAATIVIVAIVALLACWMPARKATTANPMMVLRGDG